MLVAVGVKVRSRDDGGDQRAIGGQADAADVGKASEVARGDWSANSVSHCSFHIN
jgi:hypothetical protein